MNTTAIIKVREEDIEKIRKFYADQGMTERYRPLTDRLKREKIDKLGKRMIYIDRLTDGAKSNNLARRIVEKRAAQTVHRLRKKGDKYSNRFRQSVRRATSFSLANLKIAAYDANKRVYGSHWKKDYDAHGNRIMRAKKSYTTFEEAQKACVSYMEHRTWDSRTMSAYQCRECGRWHIGHDRPAPVPTTLSDAS